MSAPLSIERFGDTVRFDLRTGRDLAGQAGLAGGAPERGQMRALLDEVVAAQLVLRGPPQTLAIRVEPIEGPAGPSKVQAELFVERAVRIDAPSQGANIISQGPGDYPDILMPSEQVEVPASPAIAVLWLDLWVPPDSQPGLHRVQVRVGTQSALIELQVLDLRMPRADVARLGTVNFGSLLNRDKAQPGSLLRWMQMAHAHYLSVEVLRPRPQTNEDGTIDWESWAKLVGPFVDGSAFSKALGYQGPRADLPTTRFVLPHTDWWPAKAKDHLPEDPERFSAALADWERFAQGKGWFDLQHRTDWVLFVNSLDEPKSKKKLEKLAAYEALLAAAKLQERKRVLFRVDGNFGQRIEGVDDQRMAKMLDGVVDLWNLHGAPWTMPWDVVQTLQGKGERVLFYASNTTGEPGTPPLVIDSAITGARAWGWIVWRYGFDGALNWEIDIAAGCVKNPRCAEGGMMNLDATLIFRGEELGLDAHRPVPSMRLKVLRRGAQDAALLALLAQEQPEVAKRIARIIVPRALGDGVPDYGRGHWARTPSPYARARQAILQRLSKEASPLALQKIRPEGAPSLWWGSRQGALALQEGEGGGFGRRLLARGFELGRTKIALSEARH